MAYLWLFLLIWFSLFQHIEQNAEQQVHILVVPHVSHEKTALYSKNVHEDYHFKIHIRNKSIASIRDGIGILKQ